MQICKFAGIQIYKYAGTQGVPQKKLDMFGFISLEPKIKFQYQSQQQSKYAYHLLAEFVRECFVLIYI